MAGYYELHYDEACARQALGRNGYMRCCGLELMLTSNDTEVIIKPINSKGKDGRSQIIVPVKDLPKLMHLLSLLRTDAGVHPLVAAIQDVRAAQDA